MTYVFCNLNLTPEQSLRLQSELDDARLQLVSEQEPESKAKPYFDKSEIAFGNPPPSWISTNTSLRWVQLESVGFGEYHSLDWNDLEQRILVTNLSGFFADPVAESILAGILSIYRGIDQLVSLKQDCVWKGDELRPSLRTLRGSNVVLFGKGAINARLIDLLKPFDCTISCFGRGWTSAQLNDALAQADVIVSTVPDTPETQGIFDATRIAILKHGSIFANFGRGSVVDDDALADGLESGAIRGAVIDVTRDEPLRDQHRFWNSPNLILTQHSGGGTADEIDRKIDWFLENYNRYRSGEPLRALVDFTRGY